LSGTELAEILRRHYKIEVEMAAPSYIIAMTGIGDTDDSVRALAMALTEIDSLYHARSNSLPVSAYILPEKVFFL
jgi:arginine/lysine/ornithine decarboxylase